MSVEIPIEIKGTARQAIAAIGAEIDKLETKGKKAGSSIDEALASAQAHLDAIRAAAGRAAGALESSFGGMVAALRRTEDVLERIRGPMREHERDLQALQLLYRQGRVSASEYTSEVQRMNAALRSTPKQGFGGGMMAGIGGGLVGGGAAGVGMAAAQTAMGGVHEVTELADAYTNLGNRLNQVAHSEQEHAMLMARTHQIADAARADWASTSETFVRLTNATKEMGLSQDRVLQLTGTISKAFAMSGASASEASAGMLQLSQAFASGRLQGDEFRSLAEAVPSVLDLIAKEMHVSRGELKQLGSEGKITSEVLVAAFTNAQQQIDAGFAKTAPTISQQWTVLKNQLTETFGQFAQDSHVFELMGRALKGMADTLGPVVKAIGQVLGKVDELMNKLESSTGIDFKMGASTAMGALNEKIGVSIFDIDDAISGANNVMPPFLVNLEKVNEQIERFAQSRGGGTAGTDSTPWGKTSQQDIRTSSEYLKEMIKVVEDLDGSMVASRTEMLKTYLGDLATEGFAALDTFGSKATEVFASMVPDAIDATLDKFNQLGTTMGSLVGEGFNKLLGIDAWNTPAMVRDQMARRSAGRGRARSNAYERPIDNPWVYSGSERVQQGIDAFMGLNALGIGDDPFGSGALAGDKMLGEKLEGLVGPEQHKRNMKEVERAYEAWASKATDTVSRVNRAWNELGTDLEKGFVSAADTIADSLSDAAMTGEFSFRKMVDTIVGDMTRIGIKGLIHFGAKAAGIPGFASGGSFTVGGSGGVDTTPVMFMATPGERVTVSPPGEAAHGAGRSVGVTNVVQMDPRALPNTLGTAAGQREVMNVLRLNLDELKRMLGSR